MCNHTISSISLSWCLGCPRMPSDVSGVLLYKVCTQAEEVLIMDMWCLSDCWNLYCDSWWHKRVLYIFGLDSVPTVAFLSYSPCRIHTPSTKPSQHLYFFLWYYFPLLYIHIYSTLYSTFLSDSFYIRVPTYTPIYYTYLYYISVMIWIHSLGLGMWLPT